MAEFTTKKGLVLELKKVSLDAVWDLSQKAGGFEAMKQASTELKEIDRAAITGGNNLTNYLFGEGVVNFPDEEDQEELKLLGVNTRLKRATRAAWLRYLVLEGKEESARLVAEIMSLSAK